MGLTMLAILLIVPLAYGAKLHGYTLYDPSKYQCQIVNGGWTEWSCFGPCSVSCGNGFQKRYRHCAAPIAKYGGKACVGDHVEIKKCDSKLKCPVDGGWSEHVKGECSKTCGGGTLTYTRSCNAPKKSHCGRDCVGHDTKVVKCNTHKCPGWGQWKCSKTCHKRAGKCVKKCARTCLYHKNDKKYCTGNHHAYRDCPYKDCKSDVVPRGVCSGCHKAALRKASSPKYPEDFVGLACRATELTDFCKTETKSKNGGIPANHWFWIHCSPDGPWCKPCATRGLVFNLKCDACEKTRDGPCTGSKPHGDSPIEDEDEMLAKEEKLLENEDEENLMGNEDAEDEWKR